MRRHRAGFTLFELILSIALSAALLGLIGSAINLYLVRVDAGRTRVEEAQLARSILAMIADDIRATTIYVPQDTSAIAELIASNAQNNNANDDGDDDDDDDSDDNGGGDGSPSTGATGGTGSAGAVSFGGGSQGASGGSDDNDDDDEDSSSNSEDESYSTLPLGLSGTLSELYVDTTRLPRRDEFFGTITGYTNAAMPLPTTAGASSSTAAGAVPASDLKTVRYFIRQGEQIDPASLASTSLAPELQQLAAGLVRQEIPRPMRTYAEQSGNTALLEAGQALIAPEVIHIEFRYYDGERVTEVWDMQEANGSLPAAIEVRIWLFTPDTTETADRSTYDTAALMTNAHEYRQTVHLPMASVSESGAGGSTSSSSSSGSSSDSSSSQRSDSDSEQ